MVHEALYPRTVFDRFEIDPGLPYPSYDAYEADTLLFDMMDQASNLITMPVVNIGDSETLLFHLL